MINWKRESQNIVYIYSEPTRILIRDRKRQVLRKFRQFQNKEIDQRFFWPDEGVIIKEETPQPFNPLLPLQISWLQRFKWSTVPPSSWSPLDSRPVYSGFLPEWKISSASVKIPPRNLKKRRRNHVPLSWHMK